MHLTEAAFTLLTLAQTGQATDPNSASQGQPFWVQLFFIIPLVVIFYFVLIRPQNLKMKEQEIMVKGVKSGDRVVVAGGIIGTVTNLTDDVLTVKIADNVKIEVQRASLLSVIKPSKSDS